MMTSQVTLVLVLAIVVPGSAGALCAQSSNSVFAPLTLGPAPSQTRLATGAPGPHYWQNRADYAIRATLDTAAHTVRGDMTFRYTNHSPDTLDILWMQTEQDPDMPITQFAQQVGGRLVPTTLENHTTETKVTLAHPITPGTTAEFHVVWSFPMNPGHGGRMQRQGTLYEVAQWYPRVNVYDDVNGWNTEPYTTGAEFYLEYGDYSLELTLPASYIVAATGTLDNPADVLTDAERSRLALAARSDTTIRIVTPAELQSGAARSRTTGMMTWIFHAKNVRDMVWCASPDYQWDATSWQGVLAQSYYYGSDTGTAWRAAANMARMSIQQYSEQWFPYPYPQVSVVDGPVYGDEYPMLSMDGVMPKANQTADQFAQLLYEVITHEVGHNWFPMLVGSNERVHTWQDEGFNQYINTFSEAHRYPQAGDQRARALRYIRLTGQSMVTGKDTPLETGAVIGNAGPQYFKTAAVLEMLRHDVIGPEAFDRGLRLYIQRWANKHPTPMDFFRTMNDAAGRDLSWFWREWFLTAPHFDQAIDAVQVTRQGDESHVSVTYGNKQAGVMPLRVRFTFDDRTTQDYTYPVEIWKTSNTYSASYTFSGKTVTQVAIDPDRDVIDANRADNTWTAK